MILRLFISTTFVWWKYYVMVCPSHIFPTLGTKYHLGALTWAMYLPYRNWQKSSKQVYPPPTCPGPAGKTLPEAPRAYGYAVRRMDQSRVRSSEAGSRREVLKLALKQVHFHMGQDQPQGYLEPGQITECPHVSTHFCTGKIRLTCILKAS